LYGLNGVVSRQSIEASGDTQGTGVAAWQGNVYAYFGGGNSVISADLTQYTGPRLRVGNSSGFGMTTLYPIIGANTLLSNYGCLAFDTGNNQLYLARHLNDAAVSGPPIVVFPLGQFTSGLNQAPQSSLGSGAGYNNLRLLAHGGNKDWLAAATSDSGLPGNIIYLWQHPLTAPTPRTITLGGTAIRGLAFDGYNS
jgi:hypothetical protein